MLGVPYKGTSYHLIKKNLCTLTARRNGHTIRNMSNHKTTILEADELEHFADMFKALSNPNRLKIFMELLPHLASGEICSSNVEQADACQQEMAERMNLAPSTVSHHIKELKNAGLVQITRSGRNVDIQINLKTLERLRSFLQ